MFTELTPALGMVAAVSLGTSDFLATRASRAFGTLVAGFAATLVALLAYGIVWSLSHSAIPRPDVSAVLSLGFGSVLMAVATLLLYAGLRSGPAGVVSPISAAYPLVTLALGVAVFGTRVSAPLVLAIVAVAAGVCLCCGVLVHDGSPSLRGPALGLGAAIAWGASYPLIAQGTQSLGWRAATLLELMVMTVLFAAAVWVSVKRDRGGGFWAGVRGALGDRFVVGCGAVQVVGLVSLNLGLEDGAAAASTTAVTSLSSCYPLVTIVLARTWLNEVLARSQLAGAAVLVAGVAAVSSAGALS